MVDDMIWRLVIYWRLVIDERRRHAKEGVREAKQEKKDNQKDGVSSRHY